MKLKVLLNTVEKIKKFNAIIMQQEEDFDIVSGRYIVDAKSIMGLFSLNLSNPIILVSTTANQAKMSVILREFLVPEKG